MKKIINRIAIFVCMIVGVTSCTQTSSEDVSKNYKEALLQNDSAAVSCEGFNITAFDPKTDQITYDGGKTSYMVTNIDYTKQYTLTIKGDVELDEEVTVSCRSNGLSELATAVGTTPITMEVIDRDETSGMVWLWSSEKNLGFALKFYE